MSEKPRSIYILTFLWLSLAGIFTLWGAYSLSLVVQIPAWRELGNLLSVIHFGYLMSTISWFVFSSLFIIIAYGTFRKDGWVWTTGLIISTIFLAMFALMLASFMINALMFFDFFSVVGLVTVILTFIIDLGIIFYLTRPVTKLYFETNGII